MTKENKRKSIFLLEEHPIMAAGISSLINEEDDLFLCGKEKDSVNIEEKITTAEPDLIFLDVSLYGQRGLELIKKIKKSFPTTPILVYTENEEVSSAPKVIRSGAMGYVMKGDSPSRLLIAIRKVLSGRIYLSERVLAQMNDHFSEEPPSEQNSPIDLLSNRELQVTQLIGKGLSDREISRETGIPVPELMSYYQKLGVKLGLESSDELFQFAAHWVHHEGGFSKEGM